MDERLKTFEKYVAEGMTTDNMIRSLELIGAAKERFPLGTM